MTKPLPGKPFPDIEVPRLGGGTLKLGDTGQDNWAMVIVYRGLHCPLCKKYLAALNDILPQYAEAGVEVMVVSGDPEEKAKAFVDEVGVTVPTGYGLTPAQMQALGLYISDPRSPKETDRPFSEPGMFVVNEEGNIQVADISNAPWARPDLEMVARGIKFIRENSYPIRGTHGI